MREACSLIWSALVLLFRSRASLAAEILVLRHQINILRRHSPKRQTFSAMDRLIFARAVSIGLRKGVQDAPPEPAPAKKTSHWGKRKLKRHEWPSRFTPTQTSRKATLSG